MDGWVYFATSKKRPGEVKIGFSKSPAMRVRALGGQMVAVQVGGKALEKKLHRKFRKLSVGYEWFRFEEPLEGYVQSLPGLSNHKFPNSPIVTVAIDREYYQMVLDAAKAGTRSVAHQLRLIFETYFNGGKQ